MLSPFSHLSTEERKFRDIERGQSYRLEGAQVPRLLYKAERPFPVLFMTDVSKKYNFIINHEDIEDFFIFYFCKMVVNIRQARDHVLQKIRKIQQYLICCIKLNVFSKRHLKHVFCVSNKALVLKIGFLHHFD